ncbi:MAG: hypothetical protein OXI77_07050 [Chloroflexota bacterium]|nr:hypothetical protein [Chloroflexota bacterium]MDE2908403.1 hypothetical protein [Chloroflexota bacterium]
MQGDVFRQQFAPPFHVVQEIFVDAGAAADALSFDPLAQRALGNGFTAETRLKLCPFVDIVGVSNIEQAGFAGGIVLIWPDSAVVDAEFFKVGQNACGRFARIAVTPQLKGWRGVPFQILLRHFGFDEEMPGIADMEAVIRVLRSFEARLSNDDSRFMPHLSLVAHIPAQRRKQRIDKLDPYFGFAVGLVAVEFFDQLVDAVGRAHRLSSVSSVMKVSPLHVNHNLDRAFVLDAVVFYPTPGPLPSELGRG